MQVKTADEREFVVGRTGSVCSIPMHINDLTQLCYDVVVQKVNIRMLILRLNYR
jgi:hypothetical protein